MGVILRGSKGKMPNGKEEKDMTVKEYRENTSLKEQEEFARKLQTWLAPYTDEVYVRVIKQMDDILNNEFALNLINELHEREQKEKEEEVRTILFSLGHDADIEKYGIHNHCLSHSNSYRDVLYDMFIR